MILQSTAFLPLSGSDLALGWISEDQWQVDAATDYLLGVVPTFTKGSWPATLATAQLSGVADTVVPPPIISHDDGYVDITLSSNLNVWKPGFFTFTATLNGITTCPVGTLSPITCKLQTDLTIFFNAPLNSPIADVVVDGVSIGATPYYTFSNLQANHSVHVRTYPSVFSSVCYAGFGGVAGYGHTAAMASIIICESDTDLLNYYRAEQVVGPSSWADYQLGFKYTGYSRLYKAVAGVETLVDEITWNVHWGGPWDPLLGLGLSYNSGVVTAFGRPAWGNNSSGNYDITIQEMITYDDTLSPLHPCAIAVQSFPNAENYGGGLSNIDITYSSGGTQTKLQKVRRTVLPVIDNAMVPHVFVNAVAPASGTDAFNQDDQGRLLPTKTVTNLGGGVCLIGQSPWNSSGFGNFGTF